MPLALILSNMNNFHPLEVVNRVSETQVQVGENYNIMAMWIVSWSMVHKIHISRGE